jgi:hypothetical protein
MPILFGRVGVVVVLLVFFWRYKMSEFKFMCIFIVSLPLFFLAGWLSSFIYSTVVFLIRYVYWRLS